MTSDDRQALRLPAVLPVPALGSREFIANPHPTYRWLQENFPVFVEPRTGALWLTRHADIQAALKDGRLRLSRQSRRPEPKPAGPNQLTAMRSQIHYLISLFMATYDPAQHAQLRALTHGSFGPKEIVALLPTIETRVDRLLDRQAAAGSLDVVADLAEPLAIGVIADVMGFEPRPGLDIPAWARAMHAYYDPLATLLQRELALFGMSRYVDLVKTAIAEQRERPGPGLVGRLVAAEAEGRIDEDHLVANCAGMFFAGHQSVGAAGANAVWCLLRHPEQLARLRAEPELLPTAVDELLRFESAVCQVSRAAHATVEVRGVQVHPGEVIFLLLGAANRDPEVFEAPDELRLDRRPNPMFAFGHGLHYCIGAALTRMELQILLKTLLQRLPRLALAETQVEWEDSMLVRALKGLRVVF